MAAKRLTLGDLVLYGRYGLDPRRARRFDALNERFIVVQPPGVSQEAALQAAAPDHWEHRRAMTRLLCELADLPPPRGDQLSPHQLEHLLVLMLKTYLPAFGPPKLVRPPGRPAIGLTTRQKDAIYKAVEKDGLSVNEACRRQVRGKGRAKRALAMAAAYRRATKHKPRRK
jgi:hypothetical protein